MSSSSRGRSLNPTRGEKILRESYSGETLSDSDPKNRAEMPLATNRREDAPEVVDWPRLKNLLEPGGEAVDLASERKFCWIFKSSSSFGSGSSSSSSESSYSSSDGTNSCIISFSLSRFLFLATSLKKARIAQDQTTESPNKLLRTVRGSNSYEKAIACRLAIMIFAAIAQKANRSATVRYPTRAQAPEESILVLMATWGGHFGFYGGDEPPK